jgi:Sec-independent protein secretion pathway component TatC
MISPFLLAIPLLLLYGISIAVSYVFRQPPATATDVAEGTPTL